MARDTTATDRLGLDRPELLADWASSWDELVELIDEDLVQSGQTADRPQEGTHDEELYVDYEASIVYYWDADGSSWETAIDGSTGYTDEDAQDAIGAALSDDFNYDDSNDSIDMSPHTSDSSAHHAPYTDSDAVAAVEAESPLTLEQTQIGVTPSMGGLVYPFSIQAGHDGQNLGMAIVGDPDGTNHGNLNWHHSNGNYCATISGHAGGDHLSFYVADVNDVSNNDGDQKKAMDLHTGPGGQRVDFPNVSQMKLWEQAGDSPVQLDLHASPGENAFLRWFSSTGTSPGSGELSYGLWEDGTGDMQFYDYTESQYLFEYVGNGLRIPAGVEDGDGDVMLDEVVAQGTVQLSEGSATVSTGVTTTGTNLNVHLDPSGDGANSTTVGASARAVWNNSAGEYEIEILEDGTDVGNPTIGYKVVTS